MELELRASITDWEKLQKTAQWCLALAFLAFGVELLLPGLFPQQTVYRFEGKLSGLFSEPSHVAFSLFPCIAILLIAESKVIRRRGMFALLGLLIFSRSSTLLALILTWVIYRLLVKKNYGQTVLVTLGIASLVALGGAIDFDRFILPTIQRVMGSPAQARRLTSLAWSMFRVGRMPGLISSRLKVEGLALNYGLRHPSRLTGSSSSRVS